MFGRYLHLDAGRLAQSDKKIKHAAGATLLRLNGCVGCHDYVYLPTDKRKKCAKVKADGTVCNHPRFDAQNKPLEVYFFLIIARCYA